MKSCCVVLLSLLAVSQAQVICDEKSCVGVICDNEKTANVCLANSGELKINEGFCQCCDICLRNEIGDGQDCTSSMRFTNKTAHERWGCQDELFCEFHTRKCRKPSCAEVREEIDRVERITGKQVARYRPLCVPDGTYAGKQCTPNECYCVDTFGTSLGYTHRKFTTDAKIRCNCARALKAQLDNAETELAQCGAKGDYERVQCQSTVCYCVDEFTGQRVDGLNVPITKKNQMTC